MEFLDVRFSLRNRMRNSRFHNSESSIPKSEITQEKEPELFEAIGQLAKELAEHPEYLLTDTYTLEERILDWNALVKKDQTITHSRSRIGHKLLDHHMPHFWKVSNPKGKSVASMITYDTLFKAILLNVQMHSTPYKSEIRRTIILTSGLANVTKYRASVSKFLVKRYDAKIVLDPCIGWGGRMLGTLAAGASYIGCEPDPNTFQGLQHILEDIRQSASIHEAPAESYVPTIPNSSVDMILTSPPYYTLELYTSGNQSVKENMSWETWISTWLRPLVLECLRCLKPDGKSCWSVKNFRINNRACPLADVVRDIHVENGYSLIETFTLHGARNPRFVGTGTKPSEEQTFVFAKTTL
jgi:hypothetical protein